MAPAATLSLPTAGFSGTAGSVIANFPININALQDENGVLGLDSATFAITYPTGVFSFPIGGNLATTDVTVGTVPAGDKVSPGGAADWTVTANVPEDGVLDISLSEKSGKGINPVVVNTPTLASGGSLTAGTTYTYVVTATYSSGEILPSVPVSITPTSGNQTVNLSWPQASSATGYKIYRTTTGTFSSPSLLKTITGGSTTSFADTGTTALASGAPPAAASAISGSLVNIKWPVANNYDPATATPQTITLQSVSGAAHTSLVGSNGTYLLDPAPPSVGSITINPKPQFPPTITSPQAYTTETNLTHSEPAPGLLAGASDPQNETLFVNSIDGIPYTLGTAVPTMGGGSVTVNADGSFSYTPVNNFAGSDSFTFTAVDSSGNISNAATVGLTVMPTLSVVVNPGGATNDTSPYLAGDTIEVDVYLDNPDPLGGNGPLTGFNIALTYDPNNLSTDPAGAQVFLGDSQSSGTGLPDNLPADWSGGFTVNATSLGIVSFAAYGTSGSTVSGPGPLLLGSIDFTVVGTLAVNTPVELVTSAASLGSSATTALSGSGGTFALNPAPGPAGSPFLSGVDAMIAIQDPTDLHVYPQTLPSADVNAPYAQQITATNGKVPYTFTIAPGTTLPAGLTLSNNGTTGLISGTPTVSNTYTFTVDAADNLGDSGFNVYQAFIVNQPLTINTSTLAIGEASVPYSQTISVAGGSGSYVITSSGSLPSGVTLSTKGVLSGTPTTGGSYNFTVTVTDSQHVTTSKSYTVTINPRVMITTTTLVNGFLDVPFNKTIGAAGGTGSYSFAVTSGALPVGLILYPTGVLGGTPTGLGSSFMVTATDTLGGKGSCYYTFTIVEPMLFTTGSLANWSANETGYMQSLSATGGSGTLTFTTTAGTLPTGLALGSSGAITGTPTVTGSFTFTVTAIDALGDYTSASYTIVIYPPGKVLTVSTPSTAVAGTSFSIVITAMDTAGNTLSNYTGPVTLSSSLGPDISPTSVTLTAGTATVPVMLDGAGSQTITVADPSSSATPGTAAVTVGPGPFSLYILSIAGSSSVPADKGILVSVQAADQFGNTVSSYSGPTSVKPSITPYTPGASCPTTVSLNSHGFGLFLATVQKAGNYVITATATNSTNSSNEASVTVTAGAPAALSFGLQPTNTPTGVPLSPVTVQVLDQFGNLVLTDNTDTVTVAVASGPGGFTKESTATTSVLNGVATFNNLTLAVPGSYTLREVVSGKYTGLNSSSFSIVPLQVLPGSFAGTPSGFSVSFNAPYLVTNTTPLLYGVGGPGSAPKPTVTLTLTQTTPTTPSSIAAPYVVLGSVVLDTVDNSLTFVETDTSSTVSCGTPILPDGIYTAVIHGTAAGNGLQALDSGGGYLDGTNSGTPGHDFTATFTVAAKAASDDVVWVPATADGPLQTLNAPGNNQGTLNMTKPFTGYPVYINDSTGKVSSVTGTFHYNPLLLVVTSGTSNGALPGSTFTVTVNPNNPGTATFTYTDADLAPNMGKLTGGDGSANALVPGLSTTAPALGFITAAVPNSSKATPTYKASDVLTVSDVQISDANGDAIPAVSSTSAVHVVAFVGDTEGIGNYASGDAVLATGAALQADSGFPAYPLVDPTIVADTDGSGFIPANAGQQINEAGVGFPTQNLAIPPIPSGADVTPIQSNAEPYPVTPANQSALEGTAYPISTVGDDQFNGATPNVDGIVASFTDGGSNTQWWYYSAFIDWGDGHVTPATITANSSSYDVTGLYTYGRAGTYNVSVTVFRIYVDIAPPYVDVAPLTLRTTATVSEAPLYVFLNRPAGVTWAQTPKDNPLHFFIASFSAGFNEPDSLFSATINWGDGTTEHPDITSGLIYGPRDGNPANWTRGLDDSGIVTGFGWLNFTQDFGVWGTHYYTAAGVYLVSVTVTENPEGSSPGQTATVDNYGEDLYVIEIAAPPSFNQNLAISVSNIAATAGQAFTGPIATIMNNTGITGAIDYSIDWGDGTTETTSDDVVGSGPTIITSHTYAYSGTYQVTILATVDVDNGNSIYTAAINVTTFVATVSASPVIAIAPQTTPVMATLNQPLVDPILATFSTTDPAAVYDAMINWGDPADPGSDNGTVVDVNGMFEIKGDVHTYADARTYNVQITLRLASGQTFPTIDTTVVVLGANVTAQGESPLEVDAGASVDFVLATFNDPDSANVLNHGVTATVLWGDGSKPTSATITPDSGSYKVDATHKYGNPGLYTALIEIAGEGAVPAIVTTDITATTPSTSTPAPVLDIEGERLQADSGEFDNVEVATFVDPNLAHLACSYVATIDWGDGTYNSDGSYTPEATTGSVEPTAMPGHYVVMASHSYDQSGAYPVVVSLTFASDSAPVASSYATALVLDQLTAQGKDVTTSVADPWTDPAGSTKFVLSQLYGGASYGGLVFSNSAPDMLVASFTDSNAQAFGMTAETYFGSFSYDEPGSYKVPIVISDGSSDNARVQIGQVVIDNVTVTPAEAGFPCTITTATVLDADSFERLQSATIDWGDGTSPTDDISYSTGPGGNGYAVAESHLYASAGIYNASTSVQFLGEAQSAPITQQVEVAQGEIYPWIAGLEGVEGVDTGTVEIDSFRSDDLYAKASYYTATVEWGDGNTSPGEIVADGEGGFIVKGSHTYAKAGQYYLVILISDDSGGYGGTFAGFGTAYISPKITSDVNGHDFGALAGITTGDVPLASLTVAANSGGVADFDATSVSINWGDGSELTGGKVVDASAEGPGMILIEGSHTYEETGTYDVSISFRDVAANGYTATAEADVLDWSAAGVERYDLSVLPSNPDASDVSLNGLTSIGEAQVSPNTGALMISQPLDFDQSPGTDLGGNPALVYNSSTVDVHPLVETTLDTKGDTEALVQVQASVDNGSNWDTVSPDTSNTSDHSFLLTTQDPPALTNSQFYQPSIDLHIWADLSDLNPDGASIIYADPQTAGAPEVVQDNSPLGGGWGIQGVDELVAACGQDGLLWVDGSGSGRLFKRDDNASDDPTKGYIDVYTSPAGDFGKLVENADYTFTYTAPDQVQWKFSIDPATETNGHYRIFQLANVTDPRGPTRSYTYNNGQLTKVQTSDGGETTITYGSDVTITEPGGRTVVLQMSGTTLTQITDADLNDVPRTLGYNGELLTSDQWDPYNTTFGYDGVSLVSTVTLGTGLGSTWTLKPAAGQGLGTDLVGAELQSQASLTDPLSNKTQYQFYVNTPSSTAPVATGPSWLTSEITADQATQTWDRDQYGEITSWTDGDSHTSQYTYDNGFIASITNPDHHSSSNGYDPHNDLTSSVDSDGVTTTYSYDTTGTKPTYHLLTETVPDPEGGYSTTSYTYYPVGMNTNGNGNISTITDPDSNVTEYFYDGDNRQTEMYVYDSNPTLREQESTTYDAAGNYATVESSNGETSTVYDGNNRLMTELIEPAGGGAILSQKTYGYDAAGLMMSGLDGAAAGPLGADGATTTDIYNAFGLLAQESVVGDDGTTLSSTTNVYDAAANRTLSYDGDSNITSDVPDPVGRTTSEVITGSSGTVSEEQYAYDHDGQVTLTTDGDNNQTSDQYDGEGNVTQETVSSAVAGTAPLTSQNFYDGDGNLTKAIDADSHTWLYEYDDGYLTKTTDPDGNTTTDYYDGDGNLVTEVLSGQNVNRTSHFVFDDGRQTSVSVTDTYAIGTNSYSAVVQNVSYGYDLDGNVTSTQDGDGNITSDVYDGAGQLVTETLWAGNTKLRITTYGYDSSGAQRSMTVTDGSGNLLSSESSGPEDSDVRTTTDGDGNTTTDNLDAAGRVLTETFSGTGGVVTQTVFTYDAAGRVLTKTVTDGFHLLSSVTNKYDLDGNLTYSSDGDNNITSDTYNLDRLATETVTDALSGSVLSFKSFGYDPASGTQTSESVAATSGGAPVTSDSEQLDKNGNVTLRIDADGNRTSDFYDGEGRVVTETISGSGQTRTVSTTYEGLTEIQQVSDGGSLTSKTTTAYDLDGNITLFVDGDGHTTSDVYDAEGRVLTETLSYGGTTLQTRTHTYNGLTDTYQVVDALSGATVSKTTTAYDMDGNVTLSIDGDGNTTSDTYVGGRLLKETLGPGSAVLQTMLYGYNGRTETVTEQDGVGDPVSSSTTVYDLDGNPAVMTDGDGNVTSDSYNADGQVVTETVTDVHALSGQVISYTSLGYDAAGRQTSELLKNTSSSADTVSSSTEVLDGDGNVSIHTDGGGNKTTEFYDAEDRVVTEILNDANNHLIRSTTMTYNGLTEVATVTDGAGHSFTTTTAYDMDGNVTLSVDGDQNSTKDVYDGEGRVVTETLTDGNNNKVSVTNYTYSGLSTTQTVTDGNNQTISSETTNYDLDGNVKETVDGVGNRTRTTYDAAGRPTVVTVGYGTAAAATTTTGYDADGHVTSVIDPGSETWLYGYDAAGFQTSMTDPKGNTATYKYDAAGDLVSTKNRDGMSRSLSYNAAGAVTSETWYDGSQITRTETFSYDQDGNLKAASMQAYANGTVLTDAASTASYTLTYYDNQVSTVSEPFAQGLTFGYDNGNRTLVQDSQGDTISSTYDPDNQLTSRVFTAKGGQTLAVSLVYDGNGDLTQIQRSYSATGGTLAGVGSTSQTYDAGELTSITNSYGSGTADTYGYQYDLAGELKQETDDGVTTSYGYDATGQVTIVQSGSGSPTSYSYNTAGNRNSSGYGTASNSDNELTSAPANDGTGTTWTYGYDNDGNQTLAINSGEGKTWTYAYDAMDELVSATETGSAVPGQTIQYRYDMFSNLIEEDVSQVGTGPSSTTTTQYAYDGWDPSKAGATGTSGFAVWWSSQPTGGSPSGTVYLNGDSVSQVFARLDENGAAWLNTDHLGSVRVVTNATGKIIAQDSYDVFGKVTSQTETYGGATGIIHAFGQMYDPATLLYKSGIRWLNPTTGTWTTQDPSGLAADTNEYRYVGNAPTNATDPSGLEGQDSSARLDEQRQALRNWQNLNRDQRRQIAFNAGFEFGSALPSTGLDDFYDREPSLSSPQTMGYEGIRTFALGYFSGQLSRNPDEIAHRQRVAARLKEQIQELKDARELGAYNPWRLFGYSHDYATQEERRLVSRLDLVENDPSMQLESRGALVPRPGRTWYTYGTSHFNPDHGLEPPGLIDPINLLGGFAAGLLVGGASGAGATISGGLNAARTGALWGARLAYLDQLAQIADGRNIGTADFVGGVLQGTALGAAVGVGVYGVPGLIPPLAIVGLAGAQDALENGMPFTATFRAATTLFGVATVRRVLNRLTPRQPAPARVATTVEGGPPGPQTIQGNDSWAGPGLPVRGINDATRGIFELGEHTVQLRSGGSLPQGTATNIPNLSASGRAAFRHVEGRAAALMRANPAHSVGFLRINFEGGPCPDCISGIQEILSPGQVLHVEYPLPNGNTGSGYFVGGADGGWVQGPRDF